MVGLGGRLHGRTADCRRTCHLRTERSPELEEALGPGSPIVVFDQVSLAFDEKVILREVSFTLITGHTKIFLGASGAGKSTILKLIVGLLKPDAGVIWVNGERVDDKTRARADEGARGPRDGVPGGRAVRLAHGGGERRLQAPRRGAAGRRRCGSASKRCSDSSASANTSTACRRSCRAASGGAWRSRGRWPTSRASCSTTSRRPASIRSRPTPWTTRSSSCATSRASARSS